VTGRAAPVPAGDRRRATFVAGSMTVAFVAGANPLGVITANGVSLIFGSV